MTLRSISTVFASLIFLAAGLFALHSCSPPVRREGVAEITAYGYARPYEDEHCSKGCFTHRHGGYWWINIRTADGETGMRLEQEPAAWARNGQSVGIEYMVNYDGSIDVVRICDGFCIDRNSVRPQ